jgi:hypothetical protein
LAGGIGEGDSTEPGAFGTVELGNSRACVDAGCCLPGEMIVKVCAVA